MVEPISLHNVVILSHEVVRVQKAQEDGTQLQTKAFARAMDEQAKKAEENVHETTQTDKGRIREEKEKERGKQNPSHSESAQKRAQTEETGHGLPDDDTGRCIDVKA